MNKDLKLYPLDITKLINDYKIALGKKNFYKVFNFIISDEALPIFNYDPYLGQVSKNEPLDINLAIDDMLSNKEDIFYDIINQYNDGLFDKYFVINDDHEDSVVIDAINEIALCIINAFSKIFIEVNHITNYEYTASQCKYAGVILNQFHFNQDAWNNYELMYKYRYAFYALYELIEYQPFLSKPTYWNY